MVAEEDQRCEECSDQESKMNVLGAYGVYSVRFPCSHRERYMHAALMGLEMIIRTLVRIPFRQWLV